MRFTIAVICAMFFQVSMSHIGAARDVTLRDFDTGVRGTITQTEFNRAQNSATRGGTEDGRIRFGARTWTASTNLVVNRPGLTLNGAGRQRTIVQARSTASANRDNVFEIDAPRVRIDNMTIRGANALRYPDGFLGFGSSLPGNVFTDFNGDPSTDPSGAILQQPISGLVNAVRVRPTANRFRIQNCTLRRVGTGIRFNPRMPLDGFICRSNDFFTLNTMIFAAERRPIPGGRDEQTPDPVRPFEISDCNLLIDTSGPRVSTTNALLRPGRGICIDFGNASFEQSRVFPPVDLKSSVIQRCTMPRITAWNIAMNRVRNVIIRDNDLGGAGFGAGVSFRHVLHFEDNCREITIRRNTLRQSRINGNGQVIRRVAFAWLGGDNGFPRLNRNERNTLIGGAELVLIGRNVPDGVDTGDFGSQSR